MPRVSKEIQAIAEKHGKTFDKAPNFNVWARRFLTVKAIVPAGKDDDGNVKTKGSIKWRCDEDSRAKFEKAFNFRRNPPKAEEPAEEESSDE